MAVDQYIGGVEHAILHLMYASFFTKFLYDIGYSPVDEPFTRLLTQGMVLAETFYRDEGEGKRTWYNATEVEMSCDEQGRITSAVLKEDGKPVELGKTEKMSKSKNNGVDPEVIFDKFGADTMRLFILFAAPPEKELEWAEAGAEGSYRFINRVWRLVQGIIEDEGNGSLRDARDDDELKDDDKALIYAMNSAVKKVGSDIEERYNFNTAISAIMELVNAMYKAREAGLRSDLMCEAAEALVLILSPFAPHVCEEMWASLGKERSVLFKSWPAYDEGALARETVEIAVQVNGKVRGKITVDASLSAKELADAAAASDEVKTITEGLDVVKVIGVPGRLVNIVVK